MHPIAIHPMFNHKASREKNIYIKKDTFNFFFFFTLIENTTFIEKKKMKEYKDKTKKKVRLTKMLPKNSYKRFSKSKLEGIHKTSPMTKQR